MSGGPVLFLQGVLYGEKDLLKGVEPHLLSVTQEYHGPLYDLLCKYYNILPGQLPKRVPLDRNVGCMYSLPMESGMELVQKGLHCYTT